MIISHNRRSKLRNRFDPQPARRARAPTLSEDDPFEPMSEIPTSPSAAHPRKVSSLGEAIRACVVPGQTLHLAGGIGGPGAAVCELIRQFRDRAAAFTIVQSTVCGHTLNLVHAGLVRKLICAVAAEIGGQARPSQVVQKAHAAHAIELENWSLLSLQQRLMAGALGLPFMPTRSVLGSDMAVDNAASFRELADPFGSGQRVGAVQALVPDLSIVHGCIADADGNTVLACPTGEDLWGALASRDGVIVTVERILPAARLRRHAPLVRIPAHRVRAVCEVPFGLHPFSLPNPGIAGFTPYEQDNAFLAELSAAARESGSLDTWLREWVGNPGSHTDYLKRLGRPRLTRLRQSARAVPAGIRPEAAEARPGPADASETMLVVLAREIARSVRLRGHRIVLAGAGLGATAAFLAHAQLRAEGIEVDLVTGNGQIGYSPIPGQSVLATQAGVRTASMLSDTVMTQGVFIGGARNRCLSVLGAGQIDQRGNLNSSRGSDGQFLVGSGGANDALNASEVIITAAQSRQRFVAELPYVTGTGERVSTVVSSMGVWRKHDAASGLELDGCFAAGMGFQADLEAVRAACGWPLRTTADASTIEAPSAAELALLRSLRPSKENT